MGSGQICILVMPKDEGITLDLFKSYISDIY